MPNLKTCVSDGLKLWTLISNEQTTLASYDSPRSARVIYLQLEIGRGDSWYATTSGTPSMTAYLEDAPPRRRPLYGQVDRR